MERLLTKCCQANIKAEKNENGRSKVFCEQCGVANPERDWFEVKEDPMNDKMNDPKIKSAIRLLQAKGVTIKQIEEVYRYYDRIKSDKQKFGSAGDWA